MQLVLASNNAKKLAELQGLFQGLPLTLVTQGSLGILEAEEPHGTFIENALAKARHAARACGGAVLADDSGLCVGALGGAPGVVSAHSWLGTKSGTPSPGASIRHLPEGVGKPPSANGASGSGSLTQPSRCSAAAST